MTNKLIDIFDQRVAISDYHDCEPSIRTIIFQYYNSVFPDDIANKNTDELITKILSVLDFGDEPRLGKSDASDSVY